MQQRPQLAQQRRHAAGVVEVLHVVLARRLEVEQHRRLAPHAVQRVEVDVEAHAAGDRRQVHDAVGRAADREQHAHRVLERGRREDPVDRELVSRHPAPPARPSPRQSGCDRR